MFIDINKDIIKNAIFPNVNSTSIEKVTLNGNNEIIDGNYRILVADYPPYVIFKNEKNKNNLKLKIIYITNVNGLNEINDIKSFLDLENYLKNYGFESQDFAVDSLTLVNNPNRNLKLYKLDQNFLVSTSKMQIFSIAFLFYFENDSGQRDLFDISKVKVFNILDSNKKIINYKLVKDLRAIKKTFENNSIYQDLLQNINFDYKFTNNLSENKKKIPNDQYFSNVFISRNKKGLANILFSIDYKKIIENNAKFEYIFKNHEFQDDIIKYFKISSIKVVRRLLSDTQRYIPYRSEAVDIVAESSQNNNGKYIVPKMDTIQELQIFNNFKTFEITDKTAFTDKRGAYQYGVELTILDGSYDYFKLIYDSLLKEENNIKNYCNYFIYSDFSKPYNFNSLSISISTLINSMIALNNEYVKINSEELYKNLMSFVDVETTNLESAQYLLSIFNRVLNQLENILKLTKGNKIYIENWFKNDNLNTKIPFFNGYDYLNNTKNTLQRINLSNLSSLISKEVKKYTDITVDVDSNWTKMHSYVSPAAVNINNETLKFENLQTLNAFDFAKFELSIKRYNLGDQNIEDSDLIQEDLLVTKEEQKVLTRTNKTLNNFGISIPNQFKPINDKKLLLDKTPFMFEKIDVETDPTYLFLSILKNKTKNNTFKSLKPNIKNIKFGTIKINSSFLSNTEEIPFQVELLINKTDKIFSNSSKKYLSDLDEHSKYMFLFNCIQKIEALEESTDIKDEKWVPITKDMFSGFKKYKICRLKLYQNNDLDINEFEDIKLPLYDRYFILSQEALSVETQIINNPVSLLPLKNFSSNITNIVKNVVILDNIDTKIFLPDLTKNIVQLPAITKLSVEPMHNVVKLEDNLTQVTLNSSIINSNKNISKKVTLDLTIQESKMEKNKEISKQINSVPQVQEIKNIIQEKVSKKDVQKAIFRK